MKSLYINYTSIPAQIPRQLAIDILHSHGEVITLNPLVLDYQPVKPPRDAPNDEYYSTWYEITQRINFIPGIGKLGTGKVSFKGCFHNMPWGIQTHTYIPMGIELRHKWEVKGNQPGEASEPRELGSQAPASGLYLQENVEIQCNPLTISFVKKELKAASKVMIERMIKKAELLDAGVLQAMFEDGKLKTFNPMDRTQPGGTATSPSEGRWRPDSALSPGSLYARSQRTGSQYGGSQYGGSQYGDSQDSHRPSEPVEMLADTHFAAPAAHRTEPFAGRNELSGDSPTTTNPGRWSMSSSARGSHTNESSRHSSSYVIGNTDHPAELYSPPAHLSPGMASPGSRPLSGQHLPYNPADYARYGGQGPGRDHR